MARFTFCFALVLMLSGDLLAQERGKTSGTTLSVLAIGNAHYKDSECFDTFPDISYSARVFLNCFKPFGTPSLMQSRPDRLITKTDMLTIIANFITFVEEKNGDHNVGLIYYCGHGMASLAGSMYFIPGDVDCKLEDSTFEFLATRLVTIDEINQLILTAQASGSRSSQYIILADCCSSQIPSKWYEGISYRFLSDQEFTVSYDSAFLKKRNNNSMLERSANLRLDSSGNIISPTPDSSKTNLEEADFIGELIRAMTIKNNGNLIAFSSAMGKNTTMVTSPDPKQSEFDVGPLCRRTIMFFNKVRTLNLNEYFKTLTDPAFNPLTSPALLNRSRNHQER